MDLTLTALTHFRWEGKEQTTTDLLAPDFTGEITTNRQWSTYETYGGRTHYRSVPRKDTPSGKTRVYVSVEGENVWEDMAARTSRPYTLWAPHVKAALIKAGWPEDITLRWSQKAGCSCPCSPAFFVTGGPTGHDLHATIVADTVQTENVAEFNARAAQITADPTLPATFVEA